MKPTARSVLALATLALTAVAGSASARSVIREQKVEAMPQQQLAMLDDCEHCVMNERFSIASALPFQMADKPVGDANAPSTTQPGSLHGNTIAVLDGGDLLVLDEDGGNLVRTARDGSKVGSLKIGQGASQLVVDAKTSRAYVADRHGDRVVVVDFRDGLVESDAFRTSAEPFGLALSPDRKTLLVTTVADKSLTAFNLSTGFESWSMTVGPEPRGVAFSPEGDEALVTFLTTGVVGHVKLDAHQDDPRIDYVSLDPSPPSKIGRNEADANNDDVGRSFARNAFVAAYAGNGVAVVPHQLSTPHLASNGDFASEGGGYGGGGGFQAPISHRLAFLGTPDQGDSTGIRTAFATTNMHQPRAATYDAASDTMFVVGYGSDDVMAIADVSQANVHLSWKSPISAKGACGPNGIAFDAATDEVVVFCSLSRTTARLDNAGVTTGQSEQLSKSHLSASARRGQAVFRRGNSQQISTGGAMACASCHAEGRADGLTWFLQGAVLQTPFLSGRVMGSHPFKWDGKDANIKASLTNTVQRLGGTGLSKSEVKDLQAFLASMPQPRTPQPDDLEAVARGEKLFESDATGCADCHNGPLLTDQKMHEITADLPAVDTPSLIGLANSAPYYHDGSAPTLASLLRGKGNVHGMGRTSKLNEGQIGDLVAYMESL